MSRHAQPGHPQAREITELIALGKASSRGEIARILGVAPSTVSLRVQELLDLGVLEEGGEGTSRGGRRPRILRLGDNRGHILVVDIGGRHARLGRLSLSNTLLETREIEASVEEGPLATLEKIIEAVALMRADLAPGDELRGVGVALPGPVDIATGIVELPSRMPGWQGFGVLAWLENRLGVPVVVDNDANLAALGQHYALLGEAQHSITVKAGSAIGSGIIVSGRLHRGATAAAGDVTHTRISAASEPCSCGNIGCLETVASGASLVRQLRAKGVQVASTADVLALTHAADPLATTLVRTAGTHLGEVLNSVVNFFNPHALFLTGGMASCEPFIAAVRSRVYEGCHPLSTQDLRIEAATLGPDSGLLGAGRLVLERVLLGEG